ncbi:MAG: hypothetical protein WCS30_08680 [Selenomonadaceae bacterium]
MVYHKAGIAADCSLASNKQILEQTGFIYLFSRNDKECSRFLVVFKQVHTGKAVF